MKRIICAAIIGIGLTACTLEPQGGELKKEFHRPMTYAAWEIEKYRANDGQKVCTISSGYNGITIYVKAGKDKEARLSVASNRDLIPGARFRITINGNYYRTSEKTFSDPESIKITRDLAAGEIAYLEWLEPHGSSPGRLRHTNAIKTEGFAGKLQECKK